jgi:hypothetical protein
MRLEVAFVLLPLHEFLGAADAADQEEAEQLLVAVVRLGPSGRTHGASLNGWRNASPAFSPGTGNTSADWDTRGAPWWDVAVQPPQPGAEPRDTQGQPR